MFTNLRHPFSVPPPETPGTDPTRPGTSTPTPLTFTTERDDPALTSLLSPCFRVRHKMCLDLSGRESGSRDKPLRSGVGTVCVCTCRRTGQLNPGTR